MYRVVELPLHRRGVAVTALVAIWLQGFPPGRTGLLDLSWSDAGMAHVVKAVWRLWPLIFLFASMP